MSESEPGVLGKRARGGNDGEAMGAELPPDATMNDEDDSDDEVGPMPMSAEVASNGGAKKKRKGLCCSSCPIRLISGVLMQDILPSFTP
jgi:peptidylprolyl isomerase domain and WD repeat-containing protein 1